MACKKQTVPFRGTPEQEAALKAVIADLKSQPGALMPVMQKAQEIYGYLPIEVQTIISDEMEVPLEKVYGVATFYAQFALQPKGQYKISLRSKRYADVNKIAGVYGGGGHVRAAGCMLFGDVEEILDKLVYTVSQYL